MRCACSSASAIRREPGMTKRSASASQLSQEIRDGSRHDAGGDRGWNSLRDGALTPANDGPANLSDCQPDRVRVRKRSAARPSSVSLVWLRASFGNGFENMAPCTEIAGIWRMSVQPVRRLTQGGYHGPLGRMPLRQHPCAPAALEAAGRQSGANLHLLILS
jgi:hypothetical protein